MSVNSPARLLHRHLTRLRGSAADRRKVRDVIATTFGLAPDQDPLLRRALLLLDRLFVDAEQRLLSLPQVDHERFLRHFPNFRRGIANLHFENRSSSAFNFITDAALENLDLAAARIAEQYRELEIPHDEISTLEAQVKEVFDFVGKTELEPRLKEVALDLLETLRQAIAEYQIRGVDGLLKAVEASLGKLLLYYKSSNGDVPTEAFQRLWTIVVRVEAVVARVLTYGPYLSDSFQRILGGA